MKLMIEYTKPLLMPFFCQEINNQIYRLQVEIALKVPVAGLDWMVEVKSDVYTETNNLSRE